LGGLIGTSEVSFAIRPQGAGVLWVLEADWQDNEGSYSNDSKAFMAALISGGTYSTKMIPVPALSTLGLLLLALGLVFLGMRQRARI